MASSSQLDIVSKLNLSKIKNEESLTKYGESFQNNILKSFLLDHQFYLDTYDLLDKNHFSKYQSYIFEQFINYFEKYNKLPAKETLLLVLQDDKILEDNKKTISEIISDIYNLSNKINDLDYYKDKVIKFIRNNRVKDAMFKSIKLMQEEDYDGIVAEITNAVKEIEKNRKLSLNFFKSLSLLSEFIKDEYIPTPYPALNKIVKGFYKKALTIFMGGTSAGKSFLMQIISMWALIEFNVDIVYYTLEMSEIKVAKRLVSILLKKHIEEVTDQEVRDINKILLDKGITAQYHIVEFPSGQATVNKLKRNLEKLRSQFNINPPMIVIDYADLLKPSTKRSDKRYELSDIYTDIRGWGVDENLAMISGSQLSRVGFRQSTPGIDTIGEDWGKAAIMDLGIIIGRSVEDRLANTGRAIIGKNRGGRDAIILPMKMDLDKGIIEILDDIQQITNPNDFKEEFDNSDYISELINGD